MGLEKRCPKYGQLMHTVIVVSVCKGQPIRIKPKYKIHNTVYSYNKYFNGSTVLSVPDR